MLKADRQRHGDRYHLVFCDGHVEAIPRRVLFGIEDSATRRLNRTNESYLIEFWKQSYEE
jgi:prepilin-type processing-associated H-X9-DG protein